MKEKDVLPITFDVLELLDEQMVDIPIPLEASCVKCGRKMLPSDIRGRVASSGDNATFEGHVICCGCSSIMPMGFEIHDGLLSFRQGDVLVTLKIQGDH